MLIISGLSGRRSVGLVCRAHRRAEFGLWGSRTYMHMQSAITKRRIANALEVSMHGHIITSDRNQNTLVSSSCSCAQTPAVYVCVVRNWRNYSRIAKGFSCFQRFRTIRIGCKPSTNVVLCVTKGTPSFTALPLWKDG